MQLGMFMMPLHRRGLSYTEMYDQDRAAILEADALGFDEAWVGEHYSAKVEPITNPLQFMSTLIHDAPNITFGTGVLALAHHNAAKTAGDIAMFDHMARGRLLLGVGPGGLPSDFELFGLDDPPERGRRMLDTLDLIKRIWAADPPYDLKGRYQSVRIVDTHAPDLDIGVMPKPYQPGGPAVFTSAMNRNSGMAALAGSLGWGLISANFNVAAHTATHWARYAQGAESTDRVPERSQWRIARSIVVADSDAAAQAYLARPECGVRDYYHYLRVQFAGADLLGILKESEGHARRRGHRRVLPRPDGDCRQRRHRRCAVGAPGGDGRSLRRAADGLPRLGRSRLCPPVDGAAGQRCDAAIARGGRRVPGRLIQGG